MEGGREERAKGQTKSFLAGKGSGKRGQQLFLK